MSKLKNNSTAVPFVTNLSGINSSVGGAAAATSNFAKPSNTKQQLQSSSADVLQLKASAYSNASSLKQTTTALTTRNQAKQLESLKEMQQQQQQQQKKKRTALENISNVIRISFYFKFRLMYLCLYFQMHIKIGWYRYKYKQCQSKQGRGGQTLQNVRIRRDDKQD